jgi:lipopolysaccharide heptosyltransferase I
VDGKVRILYKNILIVKPSSLGDVVHTLPLLKDLRMGFPDAHIAWLIKRQYAGILEGNPYLNEIIPWEWDGFGLIKKLKESRFDLVIDVQGLFRSGFATFLSGAHERIGFKNARELSPLFYTKRVPVPTMDIHAVDRYRLITDYLGIKQYPPDFTIIIDEQEKGYVERLLFESGVKDGDILVMVNPSGRWQSKRWGTEKFASLCDVLSSEYGVKTVIIGGPEDISVAYEVKTLMKTAPIITAGSTTIKGLVALLSKAKVLVTNDSGPMHIAAALNVPVVAIFGPTDPGRTGPYGKGHIVVRKEMPCSPCFKKYCRDLLCMESVSVKEVKSAFKFLKGENGYRNKS